MGISGHASGEAVVAVVIGEVVLTGVAVLARALTRVLIVRHPGLDDGFIFAAYLLLIGTTVCVCLEVKWGMGRHVYELSEHELDQQLRPFWASILTYNLAMSFTKYSILLQYLRIFPRHYFKRTRWACFGIMAIVTVYMLWTFFSTVFFCSPISYFWNRYQRPGTGHCLSQFSVWFANAGINIATDFALAILPLPNVSRLQMPPRHRVLIMLAFGIGVCTCVVSCLRLQSLHAISVASDPTWANPLAAIWSCVEVNTGILCSCLPTLRPAVARLYSRYTDAPSGGDERHVMGKVVRSIPRKAQKLISSGSNTGGDDRPTGTEPTTIEIDRAEDMTLAGDTRRQDHGSSVSIV